jgi:Podovirus DNA encapsidation protein (Gp16).
MAHYHYNKNKAMSKFSNKKIKLLLEIGGRSTGKTHQYAVYCAKKDNCSLWIRRKKDELGYTVAGFLDYLYTDEKENGSNLNIGFMGKKVIELQDGKQISVDCYYNNNNEEKIVFLPISLAHKFKSAKMGNFDFIVVDEFVSIVGDYINNEEIALVEMISTMLRLGDARIIMIGNNGDPFNPIFTFFNINLNTDKEFQPIYNSENRKIGYVHNVPINPDFVEVYKNSTVGLLTAGTRYNDYALNNKSYNGYQMNIQPLGKNAIQKFRLISEKEELFIYKKHDKNEYVISEKGDKTTLAYTNNIKMVNASLKIVYDKEIMYVLRPLLLQGKIIADTEITLSKFYNWMGI